MQYLLTYVELAEGARESDVRYWTTRQVGLYQHYSRDDDCGFCILLQPQKRSAVQGGVDHLKTDEEKKSKDCIKLLLDVHLIVLSSYFQNWQSYLTALNSNFEEIVSSDPDLQIAARLHSTSCISCTNINSAGKNGANHSVE